MRKQSAGVLGVLKSQRGATSPQATVGSESASWNTASYWSDRTNSLAWDGEDERKGKPVNQELDIINEFIMALSQWAQRECDRLCFLSVSYFLNCSWKRSLWPWRVSAGRPARTHTHTHTHTRERQITSELRHQKYSGILYITRHPSAGWECLEHEFISVYFLGDWEKAFRDWTGTHFWVYREEIWRVSGGQESAH